MTIARSVDREWDGVRSSIGNYYGAEKATFPLTHAEVVHFKDLRFGKCQHHDTSKLGQSNSRKDLQS